MSKAWNMAIMVKQPLRLFLVLGFGVLGSVASSKSLQCCGKQDTGYEKECKERGNGFVSHCLEKGVDEVKMMCFVLKPEGSDSIL